MGSNAWYEHFLSGTHHKDVKYDITGILGKVEQVPVVLKKMFKRKYVVDPPTRHLGSTTWYEHFFVGDPQEMLHSNVGEVSTSSFGEEDV